jgi:hypothetical protein
MDSGILSTISALAGTAIGAVSSLGTTWITTKSQTRAAQIAAERAKREDLYGRYMDELARLYSSALNNVGVDYERLTTAYALSGRISLYATQPVADAADSAIRFIVDVALGPMRTHEEMRTMMDQASANVIGVFAKACRDELQAIA